jgi:hypothetical protein
MILLRFISYSTLVLLWFISDCKNWRGTRGEPERNQRGTREESERNQRGVREESERN